MDSNPEHRKPISGTRLAQHYVGALTPVILSAVSAWLIVSGLKGLMGFTMTRQTVFADLLGILLIVAVARWMRPGSDTK
jgi:hypothetical protein